jgi:hypothetical protein
MASGLNSRQWSKVLSQGESERVISHLAYARARGIRLGRLRIAANKIEAIRRPKASGERIRRIARELGDGIGTT